MKSCVVLFILIISTYQSFTQNWILDTVGNIPNAITNNAVCLAAIGDTNYIYSFCGIDSTLNHTGINLKAYRFNTFTGITNELEDIPDLMGKIAAGASTVGNKIYIIGGYHVLQNGNEISSDKVHVYDIFKKRFLTDGKPIPTAIDDHVQMVWRDSLIFVVTGWSNSGNVNLVQIYNPTLDEWRRANNVPNRQIYKSFGASGFIFHDTIYYFGGAQMGINFPIQNVLRKGIINPKNPSEITWSESVPDKLYNGYRMASTSTDQGGHWLGGSNQTYNYNGRAYSDDSGVNPSNAIYTLNPATNTLEKEIVIGLPMDLRGSGKLNDSIFYLIGGMLDGQQVSNQILKLTRNKYLTSVISNNQRSNANLLISPNPSKDYIIIELNSKSMLSFDMHIVDNYGNIVYQKSKIKHLDKINVKFLPNGMYAIILFNDDEYLATKLIVH